MNPGPLDALAGRKLADVRAKAHKAFESIGETISSLKKMRNESLMEFTIDWSEAESYLSTEREVDTLDYLSVFQMISDTARFKKELLARCESDITSGLKRCAAEIESLRKDIDDAIEADNRKVRAAKQRLSEKEAEAAEKTVSPPAAPSSSEGGAMGIILGLIPFGIGLVVAMLCAFSGQPVPILATGGLILGAVCIGFGFAKDGWGKIRHAMRCAETESQNAKRKRAIIGSAEVAYAKMVAEINKKAEKRTLESNEKIEELQGEEKRLRRALEVITEGQAGAAGP